MNNVWLVADSASGLGRNIADAVLESGDRVVATAHDTKRLDDLEEQYGGALRGVGRQPADATTAMSPRRAP
jgi:NAD(P)-dependent dehydrogenase (short-subunit alcohol dehydrogenase family)